MNMRYLLFLRMPNPKKSMLKITLLFGWRLIALKVILRAYLELLLTVGESWLKTASCFYLSKSPMEKGKQHSCGEIVSPPCHVLISAIRNKFRVHEYLKVPTFQRLCFSLLLIPFRVEECNGNVISRDYTSLFSLICLNCVGIETDFLLSVLWMGSAVI